MTRIRRQGKQRGFTLIELMVVVVILGSLIALVGPNVWNMLFQSRQEMAKTQMSNFQTAIDNFKLSQKRLPSTLAELEEPPEGVPDPFIDSIPQDPWGNEYEYKVLSKSKYEITAAGEDGEIGTDDDIKWPQKKER